MMGRVPGFNLSPEKGGVKLEAAWKVPWGRPPRSGCEDKQHGGAVIAGRGYWCIDRAPVKKGGTAELSVLYWAEFFYSALYGEQ